MTFADEDLRRLERDPAFTAGFGRDVIRGFRKAMQAIRAAEDSRDLYRGGLRAERLKGQRQDHHSIRLNSQWRLILEIEAKDVKVIRVEDYH